jgi:hypothetical protein
LAGQPVSAAAWESKWPRRRRRGRRLQSAAGQAGQAAPLPHPRGFAHNLRRDQDDRRSRRQARSAPRRWPDSRPRACRFGFACGVHRCDAVHHHAARRDARTAWPARHGVCIAPRAATTSCSSASRRTSTWGHGPGHP